MARRVLGVWGLLAFALLLLPTGFASFPYSADWLKYADMRIIYEINTSDIPNNEPNIYVTVDIDPSTLQSFIDRWSDVCDPADRYDWFYPTFTYASTINKGQRMLKVVEYNNWQTFTVGSCGSVELPTRFVLLLPDGVLDGGIDYQYVTHYVYAYFKYPFVDDFYDDPVGSAPEGYELISGSTNVVEYKKHFPIGHRLNYVASRVRTPRQFTVDLSKPFLFCYQIRVDGSPIIILKVPPNEYSFRLREGVGCTNLSALLRSKGESGTITVSYLDLSAGYIGLPSYALVDYIWILPQSVYRRVAYGS